jgi:head-tail adaptor
MGAGAMRERITIQTDAPAAVAITSLTRGGSTATAVTPTAHGYSDGDYVTIAGASPAGYNGTVRVSVSQDFQFTYPVDSGLTSPATGTITSTYTRDAKSGRRVDWRSVATVWAELIPLRASERLQAAAMQSDVFLRFRIRARADVQPNMHALWTPSWPPDSAQQTLEIGGVLPVDDGRNYLLLECSKAA